jgi:hypothetical protein
MASRRIEKGAVAIDVFILALLKYLGDAVQSQLR